MPTLLPTPGLFQHRRDDDAVADPRKPTDSAVARTLLSHLAYEEREITEPLSRFGFYAGQI